MFTEKSLDPLAVLELDASDTKRGRYPRDEQTKAIRW
jgi:hypothetical protein